MASIEPLAQKIRWVLCILAATMYNTEEKIVDKTIFKKYKK